MRIADFSPQRGFVLCLFLLGGFFFLLSPSLEAKTLRFSGYQWDVRPSGRGGPGPNNWSDSNAWVDHAGHLHLLLSERDGKWVCPEVYTREYFGFGSYEFIVEGPIDRLDKNVVLGLFDYPESDQGPDGTNEIDIEFSRWGKASKPIGNYTVFPAVSGVPGATTSFGFELPGALSSQIFTRTRGKASFESRSKAPNHNLLGRWTFAPVDAAQRISQLALPVHINLWLFESPVPSDGREVEIVIHAFKFRPG